MVFEIFCEGRCNPFSLTCTLLQGGKICSGKKVIYFSWNSKRQYQIKTPDGWAIRVKVLHERKSNKAHIAQELKRKYINAVHTELWYPLEEITQSIGRAMGLQLSSMFEPFKASALGKAKRLGSAKWLCHVQWLNARGCSTRSALSLLPVWAVRKHWLIVVEDSTDCA